MHIQVMNTLLLRGTRILPSLKGYNAHTQNMLFTLGVDAVTQCELWAEFSEATPSMLTVGGLP